MAQNRDGFARSSHQGQSLELLNSFIKSLQIPKHNTSKKACAQYMIRDKQKITDLAFEKAHRHAIHFKYPVLINQVRHINPRSKEGFEYKIWIAKNVGMGVTPVSLHIFFPKDGSTAKVININNL